MANIREKLNLESVYVQVIALLNIHNPQDLTMSKISQWTKIPRSTLYYYFGKSVEKIVEDAAEFGLKNFFQIIKDDPGENFSNWQEYQKHRFTKMTSMLQQFPWAPLLYFRYRHLQNEIGKRIRDLETRYIKQELRAWKRFHGEEPSEDAIRFSSYLKLGMMYGFQAEFDKWYSELGRKKLERVKQLLPKMLQLLISGF